MMVMLMVPDLLEMVDGSVSLAVTLNVSVASFPALPKV